MESASLWQVERISGIAIKDWSKKRGQNDESSSDCSN